MRRPIEDPIAFVHEMGELHDSQILGIEWDVVALSVAIHLHDLNANFEGWPEYKGMKPARLIFTGVSALNLSVQPAERNLHIYGTDIAKNEDVYDVSVHTAPGGILSVSCSQLLLEDDVES